jgi:hypothetical protein
MNPCELANFLVTPARYLVWNLLSASPTRNHAPPTLRLVKLHYQSEATRGKAIMPIPVTSNMTTVPANLGRGDHEGFECSEVTLLVGFCRGTPTCSPDR